MTRSFSRRALLTAAVGATGTLALGGCGGAATSSQPHRPWAPRTRLRIPPALRPTGDSRGALSVGLTLQAGLHEFLPGHPTPTWGINGPVLGPTVMLARGSDVTMHVENRLPETTTIHWHGLDTPAVDDGGPHQPIEPGATWSPTLHVDQPAATLWYHPHPHGDTALHVHRGLAGMLWVDDPAHQPDLPHRYGRDDLPIVLQDRSIDAEGRPQLGQEPNFGLMGPDMCVNATLQPFVDVTTELVRLRILNGSNARLYNLAFSDGRAFHVVANDLGLLPRRVDTTRIRLGPGERAEIVVLFAAGERVTLLTRAGTERIDAGDHTIMEFRAADHLERSAPVPDLLGGVPPVAPATGVTVRRFTLHGHDAINGRSMDMTRIDEVVPAGAIEIWEIENTVYSHNFHIHGCSFTILDIDGTRPEAWMSGRHDTVHLPRKQSARLAVHFGNHPDPTHPYMYHCHILRHEDAGMMGQFVTVTPGSEAATPYTLRSGHRH